MTTENDFNKDEWGGSDEEQFVIPEGYFEQLPLMITSRIGEEENKGRKSVIIQMFLYGVSIAAMFIVISGMTYIMSDGTKSLASSISTEDIIESGVLYDTEESILTECLTDDQLASLSSSAEEKKVIEEYLVEDNTDISSMLNDL
jgi:hypothetical protein